MIGMGRTGDILDFWYFKIRIKVEGIGEHWTCKVEETTGWYKTCLPP